jgi:hypothetical protein
LGALQASLKAAIVSDAFVAAVPEDVDGGTEAAVGKADDVLGAAPGA